MRSVDIGRSRVISKPISMLISSSSARNLLVEVSFFRMIVSLCCTSGCVIT